MAAESAIHPARGQSRTALVSIAAASLLVALKLGTGIATGSLGLISAGIESSGDVVAAVLTFFAVRLGGRPADPEHPYGHRRAENLGALGEAASCSAAGCSSSSRRSVSSRRDRARSSIHWYLFAVIARGAARRRQSRSLVSLRIARRYQSAALRSNAFHFAGDMAGSRRRARRPRAVGAGFAQGDAIAALVVARIIFAAAGRLICENASVLMDRAPADARDRAAERHRRARRRHRAAPPAPARVRRALLRRRRRRACRPGRPSSRATAPPTWSRPRCASPRCPDSDVVVHVEPRRHGLDLRDRVLAVALAEPLVREAHDITIFEQRGGVSVSLHLKLAPEVERRRGARRRRARRGALRERARGRRRADPSRAARAAGRRPRPTRTRAHPDEPSARGSPRLVGGAHRPAAARAAAAARRRRPRRVRLRGRAGATMSLPDAHELASRLEDDIRDGEPHMQDVVVHTEP